MSKFASPVGAVIGVALMMIVGSCAEEARKLTVTDAQLKDAPLTIAASTVGLFAERFSWHVSVNSAGHAELTIDTFPERTRKRFEVSKEQIDQLRKALIEERFFELAGEYGELVPDGSTQVVTVTAGDQSHTVKIHFLMNWVQTHKAKLREPSRAVRILVLLRSWFEEAQAVDLRKHDRLILDAVRE